MMNIDDAFPSKFIKESDLQGQPRVLTIARVMVESLDQSSGETKPVVYFQGAQKGLVLNITNKNVFVMLHGKETNNWTGRQIELYPSQTDFRGEVVACIRCRAPGGVGALNAAPVAAPLPAVAPAATAAATGANGGHTPTVTLPHEPSKDPEKPMSEEIDDAIPF